MKTKDKIVCFLMSLFLIGMIGAIRTDQQVTASVTYKKEVKLTDVDFEKNMKKDLEESALDKLVSREHPWEDLLVHSITLKRIDYCIMYTLYAEDGQTWDGDWFKFGDLNISQDKLYNTVKELKTAMIPIILETEGDVVTEKDIDYYCINEAVYEIEYQYKSEMSFAELLGLPQTKADGKFELSPMTLYISRCRISYVLEDGGEYYIPEDDYEFLLFQNNESEIDASSFFILDSKKRAYYNVEWKSFYKPGTVVGTLDKVEKNYNVYDMTKKDRYVIAHQNYFKMSDIMIDWSTENFKKFKYEQSSNTLYYDKKPMAKDKLQEDAIYEFTKKAIKGCKTDKEKVKAIHDAIASKYSVYQNWFYMDAFPDYIMRDNQYDALTLMKDKKYAYDSFADLVMECCKRLLIPCERVVSNSGASVIPYDTAIDGEVAYSQMEWNRVYINGKPYHVDTALDAQITHQLTGGEIFRGYCLKTPYEFMGLQIWEGEDYTPEKFTTRWKSIDRNNIKTTEDLRRAVVYAAYLCRKGETKTFQFKVTGKNVDKMFEAYIYGYEFVYNVRVTEKKGVLTVYFNELE